MSEQNEPLKSGQQEKIQSEPVKIETEGVFNQDYLEEAEAFIDNPMTMILKPLTQYFESIRPKILEPIKSEHKVRIFRLNDQAALLQIEATIEEFLNDGYCCHMPTVCDDFVIMDFSRRKESEENERE